MAGVGDNVVIQPKSLMSKYCRSDKCQASIVSDLRKIGAFVLPVSQYKLGFDIIVGMHGLIGLFELKNTKKDKLTINENIIAKKWPMYVSRAHSAKEICVIMAHEIAGVKL